MRGANDSPGNATRAGRPRSLLRLGAGCLVGLLLLTGVARADSQPALSYWLLRGADLAAEGNVGKAQDAFVRALRLEPDNKAAISGLLYSLITQVAGGASGDDTAQSRLLHQLVRFRKLAGKDDELWRAYAAGALVLGDPWEALHWFRAGWRDWDRPPRELLFVADWAEALESTGHALLARRLIRQLLPRLLPLALQSAHKGQTPEEHELVRSFALLLRYDQGPASGSFLRKLLLRPLDAAVVLELRALGRKPDKLPSLSSAAFRHGRILRLRGPSQKAQEAASAPASPSLKSKATPDKSEEDDGDDDDDDDSDDGDANDNSDDSDDNDDSDDDQADVEEAESAADSGGTGPSVVSTEVEEEADEPEPTRAFAAMVGGEAHGLGGLLVESAQARGDYTRGRLTLGLRLTYAHLSESQDWVDIASIGLRYGEFDLLAQGRWEFRKGKIELGVGGNLRTIQSVPYGLAHGTYDLGRGLSVDLSVGINQVVDDTSAARLIGTRDRVAAGLYFDLTQREFINGTADWHRYESRAREPLSDGYALYLEAGHRLLLANPGWSIRLSGYFEQNRLVSSLPAGLASLLLDPTLPLSDFVVPEFGMFGAGTTLRRGVPGVEPSDDRRFRLFLDAWLGYLWPLNSVGFDLQLGLGLSARRLGEFSVSAFFSNSRSGGGAEGLSWGAGLRYVY
jgi:hypothetical protein